MGLGRASATITKAKKGPFIEGGKNKGTSRNNKNKAVKKENATTHPVKGK